MLSIAPIDNADYYLSQTRRKRRRRKKPGIDIELDGGSSSDDDDVLIAEPNPEYYFQPGLPEGQWCGSGSRLLGLHGTVTEDDLRAILAGFAPDGRKLVVNAGTERRRVGWDFTLSAPKSLSVIWSQATPEMRKRIEELHELAAAEAFRYVEEFAAVTRVGKAGHTWIKSNLVIASFRHGTSRELDPQLHTHYLVTNIGVREDGKTSALHSPLLFEHKMTIGAIYRLQLEFLLRHELGLLTERDGTSFRVLGVPQDLCREQSKRRQQVESAMGSAGLHSAKAAAMATLSTRKWKGPLPSEDELFAKWHEENGRYAFDEAAIQVLLGQAKPANLEEELVAAVREGLDSLLASQAHFSQQELVRAIAIASIGRGIPPNIIWRTVEQMVAQGCFVNLTPQERFPRYTTQEMLAIEKKILDAVQAMNNNDSHVLPKEFVEKYLDANLPLKFTPLDESRRNSEQREAIKHLTLRLGQVQCAQGLAGTGKSFVLGRCCELWQAFGYRVVGMALAGVAKENLAQGSGIPSETVALRLLQLDWKRDFLRHHARQLKRLLSGKSTHIYTPSFQLDQRTVVVLDEAGMVGTKDMAALIEHIKASGAKLVLVGDRKQLQPIEAGGPFGAIQKVTGAVKLKHIIRQVLDEKDDDPSWARKAIALLSEGKASEALELYSARDMITVSEDRETAMESLIKDWSTPGLKNPNSNLIFASTRAEVRDLNEMCQAAQRASHSGPAVKPLRFESKQDDGSTIPVELYPGDAVIFNKKSRILGIENGNLGTVVALNRQKKTVAVRLKDGNRNVLVPLRDYPYVDLGYAMTVHRAQSTTIDNGFVLLGGKMQDLHSSYVGASRARHCTRFYVDQFEAGEHLKGLAAQMSRDRTKYLAHEIQEAATPPSKAAEEPKAQKSGKASSKSAKGKPSVNTPPSKDPDKKPKTSLNRAEGAGNSVAELKRLIAVIRRERGLMASSNDESKVLGERTDSKPLAELKRQIAEIRRAGGSLRSNADEQNVPRPINDSNELTEVKRPVIAPSTEAGINSTTSSPATFEAPNQQHSPSVSVKNSDSPEPLQDGFNQVVAGLCSVVAGLYCGVAEVPFAPGPIAPQVITSTSSVTSADSKSPQSTPFKSGTVQARFKSKTAEPQPLADDEIQQAATQPPQSAEKPKAQGPSKVSSNSANGKPSVDTHPSKASDQKSKASPDRAEGTTESVAELKRQIAEIRRARGMVASSTGDSECPVNSQFGIEEVQSTCGIGVPTPPASARTSRPKAARRRAPAPVEAAAANPEEIKARTEAIARQAVLKPVVLVLGDKRYETLKAKPLTDPAVQEFIQSTLNYMAAKVTIARAERARSKRASHSGHTPKDHAQARAKATSAATSQSKRSLPPSTQKHVGIQSSFTEDLSYVTSVCERYDNMPGGILVEGTAECSHRICSMTVDVTHGTRIVINGRHTFNTRLSVEEVATLWNAVRTADGSTKMGALSQSTVVGMPPYSQVANTFMLADRFLGDLVYGHGSTFGICEYGLKSYINPYLTEAEAAARLDPLFVKRCALAFVMGLSPRFFLNFSGAELRLGKRESAIVCPTLVGAFGVIDEDEAPYSHASRWFPFEANALQHLIANFGAYRSANMALRRICRYAAVVMLFRKAFQEEASQGTGEMLIWAAHRAKTTKTCPTVHYTRRITGMAEVARKTVTAIVEQTSTERDSPCQNAAADVLAFKYAVDAADAELVFHSRARLSKLLQGSVIRQEFDGCDADTLSAFEQRVQQMLHDPVICGCLNALKLRRSKHARKRYCEIAMAALRPVIEGPWSYSAAMCHYVQLAIRHDRSFRPLPLLKRAVETEPRSLLPFRTLNNLNAGQWYRFLNRSDEELQRTAWKTMEQMGIKSLPFHLRQCLVAWHGATTSPATRLRLLVDATHWGASLSDLATLLCEHDGNMMEVHVRLGRIFAQHNVSARMAFMTSNNPFCLSYELVGALPYRRHKALLREYESQMKVSAASHAAQSWWAERKRAQSQMDYRLPLLEAAEYASAKVPLMELYEAVRHTVSVNQQSSAPVSRRPVSQSPTSPPPETPETQAAALIRQAIECAKNDVDYCPIDVLIRAQKLTPEDPAPCDAAVAIAALQRSYRHSHCSTQIEQLEQRLGIAELGASYASTWDEARKTINAVNGTSSLLDYLIALERRQCNLPLLTRKLYFACPLKEALKQLTYATLKGRDRLYFDTRFMRAENPLSHCAAILPFVDASIRERRCDEIEELLHVACDGAAQWYYQVRDAAVDADAQRQRRGVRQVTSKVLRSLSVHLQLPDPRERDIAPPNIVPLLLVSELHTRQRTVDQLYHDGRRTNTANIQAWLFC